MFKNVLLPIDLDQESSWKKALPSALEFCRASGVGYIYLPLFLILA